MPSEDKYIRTRGRRSSNSSISLSSHGGGRKSSSASLTSVETPDEESQERRNSFIDFIYMSDEEQGNATQSSKKKEDWITATPLVNALASYDALSATLLTLYENHEFNSISVRARVALDSHIFHMKGETVVLQPQIVLCSKYSDSEDCKEENQCDGLHICPLYINESCEVEDCPLGHRVDTHHNEKILRRFNLLKLQTATLRKVIQHTINNPRQDPVSKVDPLEMCVDYNYSRCNNDQCEKLHMCGLYLVFKTKCPTSPCPLNHSFELPSVAKLLEKHGISFKESPKDILKHMLESFPNILNGFIDDDIAPPKTVWSTDQIGDVEIPQICYKSVEGSCEYERTGCKRLHSEQYYHWQVQKPSRVWLNLSHHLSLSLEKAYCDPTQDKAVLLTKDDEEYNTSRPKLFELLSLDKWTAHFGNDYNQHVLTSEGKSLQMRRLRSEDTEAPVPAREYVWYYRNADGAYIEFGHRNPLDEEDMAEIRSEKIELMYQTYIHKGYKMHFWTSLYTYCLDDKTMSVINEIDKSVRQVRRRPRPHL